MLPKPFLSDSQNLILILMDNEGSDQFNTNARLMWAFISYICLIVSFHMGLVTGNLSSGVATKGDSNQSPQLQRLARKLKFCW